MDKFFGYYGLVIFWAIFIILSIEYYFYDGDINTYILAIAMVNLWMWFDYRVNIPTVHRYIIEFPYEEDDGDE